MSTYMDYRIRRFNHKKAVEEGREPPGKLKAIGSTVLSGARSRFDKEDSSGETSDFKATKRKEGACKSNTKMSSREWSKVDKGGEKKEDEEQVKATPRRKRVTLKEGEEDRVVTPTPEPEGDEDESTHTPTREEGDQETVSEELAAMGQKVEEIKASGKSSPKCSDNLRSSSSASSLQGQSVDSTVSSSKTCVSHKDTASAPGGQQTIASAAGDSFEEWDVDDASDDASSCESFEVLDCPTAEEERQFMALGMSESYEQRLGEGGGVRHESSQENASGHQPEADQHLDIFDHQSEEFEKLETSDHQSEGYEQMENTSGISAALSLSSNDDSADDKVLSSDDSIVDITSDSSELSGADSASESSFEISVSNISSISSFFEMSGADLGSDPRLSVPNYSFSEVSTTGELPSNSSSPLSSSMVVVNRSELHSGRSDGDAEEENLSADLFVPADYLNPDKVSGNSFAHVVDVSEELKPTESDTNEAGGSLAGSSLLETDDSASYASDFEESCSKKKNPSAKLSVPALGSLEDNSLREPDDSCYGVYLEKPCTRQPLDVRSLPNSMEDPGDHSSGKCRWSTGHLEEEIINMDEAERNCRELKPASDILQGSIHGTKNVKKACSSTISSEGLESSFSEFGFQGYPPEASENSITKFTEKNIYYMPSFLSALSDVDCNYVGSGSNHCDHNYSKVRPVTNHSHSSKIESESVGNTDTEATTFASSLPDDHISLPSFSLVSESPSRQHGQICSVVDGSIQACVNNEETLLVIIAKSVSAVSSDVELVDPDVNCHDFQEPRPDDKEIFSAEPDASEDPIAGNKDVIFVHSEAESLTVVDEANRLSTEENTELQSVACTEEPECVSRAFCLQKLTDESDEVNAGNVDSAPQSKDAKACEIKDSGIVGTCIADCGDSRSSKVAVESDNGEWESHDEKVESEGREDTDDDDEEDTGSSESDYNYSSDEEGDISSGEGCGVEDEAAVANCKVLEGDGEASEGEVVTQEEKEVVPAVAEMQCLEESALSTGLSPPDLRILFVVMGVVTALLTSVLVNYAYSTFYSAGPATMFEGLSDGDIMAMTEKLQMENQLMLDEMVNLQEINLDPIKIKGKDGAKSRQLREEIHQLIAENEELRLAVGRLWLSEQPQTAPAQKAAFSDSLTENHRLRSETEKLNHLGSDLQDLQSSVASLKEENNDLRIAYADFKYQKVPIPKELDVVSRETESIAKQVIDASRKRKPPPNLPNARNYVAYMGQILSTMSSLHEFGEASAFGKIDIASDVFTDLVPKPSTVPPAVEQKIRQGRAKFQELKASLATKWGQLKSLSEPENIRAVGRDTLAKMNRVLVNVVSKLKEIGQTDLLRRGKTPVEKTASALADKLTVLDEHFDHTWNDLEAEVNMEAVDEELAQEMIDDDGSEAVADADEDEEGRQEESQLSVPIAETAPTSARTHKPAPERAQAPIAARALKPASERAQVSTAERAQKPASERAQVPTAERAQKPKVTNDVLKWKEDVKRVKEEKEKGKVNNSTKKDTSDDKKKPVKRGDDGTAEDKKGKEIDKSKKTSDKKTESKNSNKVQADKKDDGKRGKKLPKKAERDAGKDDNNNDVDDKYIESSGRKSGSNSKEGGAAEDSKEGGRYFKGHYNKDKTGGQKKSNARESAEKKKHLKRGDNDDDEDDKSSSKVVGSRKSGLNRHWEKPVKKNFFRDSLGSRRQFIRRKGKEEGKRENFTRRDGKWRAQRDDDDSARNFPIRAGGKAPTKTKKAGSKGSNGAVGRGKNRTSVRISKTLGLVKTGKVTAKDPSKVSKTWDEKRSQERTQQRLEGEKAEWQFDRARDRRERRESANQAEWQFDRGALRKNLRNVKRLLKQKRSEKKRLEREQRKRREDWRTYKRSVHEDDDDDDFDDDDYDYYGKNSRFVKRKTYESNEAGGNKRHLRNTRDR